jgi:hypothetical protein
VATIRPEGIAGPPPGHAVDDEARAALKPSDRLLGGRAEDSVNGSGVEAPGAQADLERGDLGIPLSAGLPGKQERGRDCEAEDEQAGHDPAIQPYVLFARLVPPANL